MFLENGSKLLEKLIVSCNDKSIPIRTFSAQELWLATNNYHNHQGRLWYNGSFEEQFVLIRLFPDSKSWTDFAINDLVISAQMSGHSNVLKPIGCCLETECPILVYEFAANGFLADRIYVSNVTQRQHQPMVWASRLKIARQIAHATSYLHIAFSRPVIHMDIHMENILLDEHDVPKLSNFIFSISIPEGETEVEADDSLRFSRFNIIPESEATGKVTEKSDTYKFGVFLLELLTGDHSYTINRLTIDQDSSLVVYLHNSGQGRSINEIVDPIILAGVAGPSLDQQSQAVLQLALTCTEDDPSRRPTMVDVTKELRRIERYVS